MVGAYGVGPRACRQRQSRAIRTGRLQRMGIGRIGIWTSYRSFGSEHADEAAKLAEQLGYGAWWVGGSPHVPDVLPILKATSTLVAATGILNVWGNDPGDTAAADAVLRRDFPGGSCPGSATGTARPPTTIAGPRRRSGRSSAASE